MMSTREVELSRVPVRVGPPRPDGAHAPVVDDDMFSLRARVPDGVSSPIGVNIDSLLLLDALQDGTVFHVESLVPRSAWRRSNLSVDPPLGITKGSVVIADPGPAIYVDQVSPRFNVDRQGRLHVELETADSNTRWVALSPDCFALVNEGFLAGLVALLQQCHGRA